MKRTLANAFASTVVAYQNCIKMGNKEWEEKHLKRLGKLLDELPHGSGIDGEWSIDTDKSSDNLLIFHCSFHHMNENGMYDGWTEFKVKVTSNLLHGLVVRVIGPFPARYSDVRDYLGEMLDSDLRQEVEEYASN